MTEYITEHYYDGESMAIHQAQREEIVRCKDCRYWKHVKGIDHIICVQTGQRVQPDGFCAWAERKVDE